MSDEIKQEVVKPVNFASKETAKNELKKMLDYYEIEIEEIEDEKLKTAIENSYNRLIKAVMKNRLRINLNDGIEIIQKLKDGTTEIKYKEINGKAKTAMAGKKEDDFYGKAYALMGSLSGLGEAAISSLKGVDLSLVEVLGLIFLAV
jgi:hypothetical protein